MSDAEPVVKPLRGRETCGHFSDSPLGWSICGLLLWSNGEAVTCHFGLDRLPCPLATKVHGLEAKLARVEALLPKWRGRVKETSLQADVEWARGDPNGTGCSCDGSWMAMDGLCDELEAALRGEGA
jgi:hypothetical protein